MSRRHPDPRFLTVLLLLFGVGCSGSSSTTVVPPAENLSLRVGAPTTAGGEADGLAASLLLSTGTVGLRANRASLTMADTALRDRLVAMARTHLETSAFHAQDGASMEGSAYIRRLAEATGAPGDDNNNGSNLDETMAQHLGDLARLAGADLPPGLRPIVMPWTVGMADFAAAGSGLRETKPVVRGKVELAQVARAMLGRLMLASNLLQRNRGDRPGATPEEGMLGLLLMQQVIAAEETVFSSMFMDDAVLGPFGFPADYDPNSGLRWLPSAVRVNEDSAGRPESYSIVDRASDLATLALLLRVGGEISYFRSDSNPIPHLRDIFRGNPFGPKPNGGPGNTGGSLAVGGANASEDLVTWESGVSTLLAKYCGDCHGAYDPFAKFRIDLYKELVKGGINTRPESQYPILTRGDPSKSAIYWILLPNPPSPFIQMPYGGPYFDPTSAEVKLIEKWILDGARSSPPGPPTPGLDMATVMYRNLIAAHLDSTTGALLQRNEGDGGVRMVDVAATGAVLQALGTLVHLEEDLVGFRANYTRMVEFALAKLTDATGEVYSGFDLEKGEATGTAGLRAHAEMTAGLLAAARHLTVPGLPERAKACTDRLLQQFFDAQKGLFRSATNSVGIRYTPADLSAVLEALRESAAAGIAGAVETHDRFLARIVPVLAFSELDGFGEVLGDGLADTDGNGLAEPALAGGAFGRAPLFTGEIKEGPEITGPTDGPVLWSKHIQPLFRSLCARCHMDGNRRGEYRLETPALLRIKGNENGEFPLVVPGDPEGSYLYRKLMERRPAAGEQMPLDTPPMAEHGRELVRRWILEGATSR
ncbi:MAG: hypothetical protein KDC87_03045 [Planctomycetes bacterium]|nr:hypothetical protein [Planctomycetota bacterium]